ncbi:sensor histidine kinase [Romboutsia ilealis]|uniref:histidine kinase n=1 Tax=Romboutsia faecis TaxID=2764597 RepID=A0ABR7JS20_9FIRM|nr:HAMP domain-containing sensor histidine kinase [Romboutsia faecis]MBC5997708.1 HAMP domain-containing histidine kinase [Romboutsia faecis]MRN25344.1 sensor histidine kinase [Romboutsia ilealis]
MGSKSEHSIIKLMLILCLVLIPKEVWSESVDKKDILYINSYSPRFEFFDEQLNGIKSVLGDSVELQVEYLDQGNFYGVKNELNFYNLIKYKINNYKTYDAILIGDDPALNFIRKHKEELFKGIPIITFGVNNKTNIEYIKNNDDTYGVEEGISLKKNLDLINKLYKNKNVVAINFKSRENNIDLDNFYKLESYYPDLNFSHISYEEEDTVETIKKKIDKIDENSIILLTYIYSYSSISYNELFELQDYLDAEVDLPKFSTLKHELYFDTIGGYMTSHYEQGKMGAEIAMDIINGNEPTSKLVSYDEVNKYIFNYEHLKKHKIKEKYLPKNSKIINKPETFWSKHKLVIIPAAIIVACLVVTIIIFIINNKKRRMYSEGIFKAKEIAESSIKAQNNFISNISHELRTPVAVIISVIQLLEKQNKDKEFDLTSSIKIIKQNCLRLTRLTNNIIDVAKMDLGFIDMRPVNIEIVSLLEDIVSSIIPYAKSKNINVIFDTEIEELVMSVDPDKIERMMLNLLSNSIKFNKNDGSIITMVKVNDSYLNIEVIDTGIGISKEYMSKIFDKFTQVEDIMIRQNEGSGIGLSLVKYFTEAHGGTISVESELNKGSRFIVRIPMIKQSELSMSYYEKNQNYVVVGAEVEFSDIYA